MEKNAYQVLKVFLEKQIYEHEKLAEEYENIAIEGKYYHIGAKAEAEKILTWINRMHKTRWL